MRSLLLLLLALPLVASAQPTFGVKAGLNLSNVYGADEADLDGLDKSAVLGFTGGLMANLPLSPSFGVRVEALYAQKGFKISGEETVAENTIELNVDYDVDYIELPVLARIAVPVGPFADAGVMIGPAPAFKVRESVDVTATLNGENVPDFNDDFDSDEALFESFDLGGVVGAEYGSGPFAVDLRYTYGFLNINRSTEDGEGGEDGPTLRNGVFSVTGVFRFGQ